MVYPPLPPPPRSFAGVAIHAVVVCLAAGVAGPVIGFEPAFAFGLVIFLARSKRTSPTGCVLVGLLVAIALTVAAFASTREPLIVAPHYVHGGGDYGAFAAIGSGLVVVVATCIVTFIGYALAALDARPPGTSGLRGFAYVATAVLATIAAVGVARSIREPSPARWATSQRAVFSTDHEVGTTDPPIVVSGCVEHNVCKVVFPSGVEASVFAGIHPPFVVRRADRERLWIVEQEGMPYRSRAVFSDDGRPAGDLYVQRIARTVAPPHAYTLVLLVGVAVCLHQIARARVQRSTTAVGSDAYRSAPESEPASLPDTALRWARAGGVACVAAAPSIGWWLGTHLS